MPDTNKLQEPIKRADRFDVLRMNHENIPVRTVRRAVPTPDTLRRIDIDLAVFVPKNGIAWRAIRHTFGVLAMPAGTRDQQITENVPLGPIQTGLSIMRRRTGTHALIAPGAFVFVDQQHIGPFKHPGIDQPVDPVIVAGFSRRHLGLADDGFAGSMP